MRNFALSVLLNNDRRTDAICTKHVNARFESVFGSESYRSKNSFNVVKSRKAGRQLVGIWTVHKSSEDSSVEVPDINSEIQDE